jgi:hypothetical protein
VDGWGRVLVVWKGFSASRDAVPADNLSGPLVLDRSHPVLISALTATTSKKSHYNATLYQTCEPHTRALPCHLPRAYVSFDSRGF